MSGSLWKHRILPKRLMVAPLLFFAYMIVYYNVIKTHCITGLGYAMLIVSSFIAIYYAVIIAYCLYFFVASMQAEVPWKYCDNTWNTCYCRDGTLNESLSDPWNGTRIECCKSCNIYEVWERCLRLGVKTLFWFAVKHPINNNRNR
jgi:hypothetical protein